MLNSGDSLNERQSLFDELDERHSISSSGASDQGELESIPIHVGELIALLSIVILSDVSIYRTQGYAGPALLFAITPVLLCLGVARFKRDTSVWVLAPMLALVSLRLVWCGSWLAVASGFILLACVAMSLVGMPPYLLNACTYAAQLFGSGFRGFCRYLGVLKQFVPLISRAHLFAIFLPLLTLIVFASIFVMANPDLVSSVAKMLSQIAESIERWLEHFEFTEVLFCFAAAWIAGGALCPRIDWNERTETSVAVHEAIAKSRHYAAYRNTLASLIGLFAIYLVFEFQTLWFKSFPKGFHYSGYAHEGAAWLTIALGLATLTLSLIFRQGILRDPRLPRLRGLAWIWSIENLLLAVSVFNRLFIYVGFNGMTQMRVVGFLGVASVVAGFLLVLRKISRHHDFVWLVRRQLWAVSFAVYLYVVLPVDAFVNQFNVNRILKGDFPPCVQIIAHQTSDEGWLYLPSLIDCSNPVIRDGVRALLLNKLERLESDPQLNGKTESGQTFAPWTNWSATQIARNRLLAKLRLVKDELATGRNSDQRHVTIREFRDYAYQWY